MTKLGNKLLSSDTGLQSLATCDWSWKTECGDSNGAEQQSYDNRPFHSEGVATPNDLKLSDRGGWRTCCAVGLLGAACVTAVAVRCSAWLGVAVIGLVLIRREARRKPPEWSERLSAPPEPGLFSRCARNMSVDTSLLEP